MTLIFICSFWSTIEWIKWCIVLIICFFISFFAIGVGPVVWIYNAEIYPMEVRSSAMGCGIALNWLTSFFAVSFSAQVNDVRYLYGIFALTNTLSYVFCLYYVAETKGTSIENSPIYAGRPRPGQHDSRSNTSVRDQELQRAQSVTPPDMIDPEMTDQSNEK